LCVFARLRERKRERKRNGFGEQMGKETTNGVKERTHSLKTSPSSSLSSSRVSLFSRLQTTTSHQFWTTGFGGSSSNRFQAFLCVVVNWKLVRNSSFEKVHKTRAATRG
jgi:hypothetical protein